MVLSVFLHMARVFYHGAYKPPREFNWVIGVILLTLTLLLSFTGYLLPWDQLALWAVTVGTNMMGYTPVFGSQVKFVLIGGSRSAPPPCLRWYVLHVLMFPFVIVIFMAVHFWRVRKDGGISGALVMRSRRSRKAPMAEVPEHLLKRAAERKAALEAKKQAEAEAAAGGAGCGRPAPAAAGGASAERGGGLQRRGREDGQDPCPSAGPQRGGQGQGGGELGRRRMKARPAGAEAAP